MINSLTHQLVNSIANSYILTLDSDSASTILLVIRGITLVRVQLSLQLTATRLVRETGFEPMTRPCSLLNDEKQ